MTFRVDPVFLGTGVQAFIDPAFRLEGLLPISIGSVYYSNAAGEGAFGARRLSETDPVITVDAAGRIILVDEDCLPAAFDRPLNGSRTPSRCNTARRLLLYAGKGRSFLVKDRFVRKRFAPYPDRVWRLTQIEDRNGAAILFERSASGRLDALVTPEHLRVEFEHDARGLRTVAHLLGAGGAKRTIMRWEYDGSRRMTRAASHYGPEASYGYDAEDRLTATATSDGYTARRDYDDRGRVTAIHTNGPFNGDRYTYDDAERSTTYVPGGDAAKRIKYMRDADDLIVKIVNAAGSTSEILRQPDGAVSAEVDGNGHRVRYRYDEDGNIAAKIDGEGRTTKYRWTEDRQIEHVSRGGSETWDYNRDENGNLVAIVDPLGFRTDLSNNAFGQPTGIMRHDGLIEHRVFDDRHHLVRVVDVRGGSTVLHHDEFGRVTSVTDPLGATTRLRYGEAPGSDFWSADRVEHPDGTTSSTAASDRGRSIAVADGEGNISTIRKGAFGHVTDVIGPTGARLRYVYDGLLRLRELVNQNGETWTFERDDAGRVVRERDVGGVETQYVYDAADRCIETRHADGTRVEHAYDRSGLLVRQSVLDAAPSEPRITTFSYDDRGLVLTAINDDASVSFERDKVGRITAEIADGHRIESTYDCCGNRTSRRIDGALTSFTYDGLGGLLSVTVGPHAPQVFTRDLMGREVRRRAAGGFQLEQAWDELGRLTRQHVPDTSPFRSPGSLSNGLDRTYAWTKASAPRTVHDSAWGPTTYDYDANGQVIQARFGDGGTERYAYDPALNVSTSSGRVPGGAVASNGGVQAWTLSRGGRVQRARGPGAEEVALIHDQRGRVIERRVTRPQGIPETWHYRWDGRDRLRECTTPSGERWVYRYDAFARRISKARTDPSARTSSPGQAYLWDRDTLCQQADLAAEPAGRTNVTTWHFEPSRFVPLALEQDGRLLAVVVDHLGTPRELFDDTGRLLASEERHLWGAPRRAHAEAKARAAGSGLDAEDIHSIGLGFQGQVFDAETQLYQNHFRVYDALSSQYMTRDPLGVLGGPRPHAYVYAPTVWVDPAGLYGVYLFETTLDKCYVGKGEVSRMQASMDYRTKAPPSGIKRCLYVNTDADAAKAGIDPKTYGALVENRLIAPPPAGYGAAASDDWLNQQYSGQSAFAAATPATQQAATATASQIQGTFGPCPS